MRLEKYGARFRYLEVSWFIKECEIAKLDRAVWELRRFCNAELYAYSENEFISVRQEKIDEIQCLEKPSEINTIIQGGFIEKTLSNKKSEARSDLIWCNLYYSTSKRKSVAIKRPVMAENSPFFLYPEIIDVVSKYTYVPNEIRNAYKSG